MGVVMGGNGKKVESYGLSADFEGAVTFHLCNSPRFYGRVGRVIVAEALESGDARLAVKAAHSIARELGTGPENDVLVIQRLRRWESEGKVTREQVISVAEYFDDAQDAGIPREDSVVAELVPILKRRMQRDAITLSMDEYAKNGDLDRAVILFQQASNLGDADVSLGYKVGMSTFDVIEATRNLERLSTGIMELDVTLGGGLPRGQEGVVIGGAGDGKSMYLSQQAAFGAVNGLHCAYATLEIPEPTVLARIKAAITGVPIDAIVSGSKEARDKIGSMELGPVWVKAFTPQMTTVEHLREWLSACEQAQKRPIDLFILDYADKLTHPMPGRDQNTYRMMELVYESLRVLAVEKQMWLWTASQSTRSTKESGKRKDLEHIADSMGKVRVADLVITLNAESDGTEMTFFIAKNRTGRSRVSIGPLPTDFACGVVAPMSFMIPGGVVARGDYGAEILETCNDVLELAEEINGQATN